MVGSFDRLLVSLSDLFSSFPLSLKMNGFRVPIFHFRGDRVHGHDAFHQGRGNASREVSD